MIFSLLLPSLLLASSPPEGMPFQPLCPVEGDAVVSAPFLVYGDLPTYRQAVRRHATGLSQHDVKVFLQQIQLKKWASWMADRVDELVIDWLFQEDIHQACRLGHLDRIREILDATPDLVDARLGEDTPLIQAANDGAEEVVKVLLQYGANPNLANGDKDTALIRAITRRYNDIACILLEAGARPDQANAQGGTPLMMAAARGLLDLTGIFLGHFDADKLPQNINQTDADGNTALILATHQGSEIVDLLLQARADVNQRNNQGQTALQRAALHGRHSLLKSLLVAGADPLISNNGVFPYQLVPSSSRKSKILLQAMTNLRLALSSGALKESLLPELLPLIARSLFIELNLLA